MKLNFAPLPSFSCFFSSPFSCIVDVTTDPRTGDVYMLDHDAWRRYGRPKNDVRFRHFKMCGGMGSILPLASFSVLCCIMRKMPLKSLLQLQLQRHYQIQILSQRLTKMLATAAVSSSSPCPALWSWKVTDEYSMLLLSILQMIPMHFLYYNG